MEIESWPDSSPMKMARKFGGVLNRQDSLGVQASSKTRKRPEAAAPSDRGIPKSENVP